MRSGRCGEKRGEREREVPVCSNDARGGTHAWRVVPRAIYVCVHGGNRGAPPRAGDGGRSLSVRRCAGWADEAEVGRGGINES